MKKMITLILAVLALALLIGCQMPDETVEPAEVEDQGSEEMEVDAALDEIDQLEEDFEEDFGLDELENLDLE